MSTDDLKAKIKEGFDTMGVDIEFDRSDDLNKYRRGKPLTLGQLRAMPEDSVVWCFYKEWGDKGPRINSPFRIKDLGDGSWDLNDGSSLGAEFEMGGADDQVCHDECGGEGDMYLYSVVDPNPSDS